jgi:glycosyltransferase involved in cell wall biosynthesis
LRITFVISSLSAGGAERVAAVLANYWARIGHCVTFITIDSVRTDFYRLEPSVRRHALGLLRDSNGWHGYLLNNLIRLQRLRGVISETSPDVVVSFMDVTNVMVLLAMFRSSIPIVVSERIDPRRKPLGVILELLRRKLYPRARGIVVQTKHVATWAHKLSENAKVFVIPNAVARPKHVRVETQFPSKPAYTLLGMGRLDRQKGFDLLIEAFARCKDSHPTWTLRIVGDGPERQHLDRLAIEHAIADRVNIDSVIENPEEAFQSADLFVLSSRYEGFPNVLLEAMSFGLPVISCECPSGPAEIIRDGLDGILVPSENVSELAVAIDRMMSSADERRRVGALAAEVVERFSRSRIFPMWDEVISKSIS